AGRLTPHQRPGLPSAHRHELDDPVALRDLILNVKAKLAERPPKAPHGLLHALRTSRQLRICWRVVDELGVDELVRNVEITLRIDLVERPTREPLVVLRHV